MRRVVAASLSIALVLGCAGCSQSKTEWDGKGTLTTNLPSLVWVAREQECESCYSPLPLIRRMAERDPDLRLQVLAVGVDSTTIRRQLDAYGLVAAISMAPKDVVLVPELQPPALIFRSREGRVYRWNRQSAPPYDEVVIGDSLPVTFSTRR